MNIFYLLNLSWKNITRYKKRTTFTFLVLSFGVLFYIFFSSFLAGINDQSFENTIDFETGHFKIRNKDYDEDAPFAESNFIEEYDKIERILDKKDYVVAYTERIMFKGEIDNSIDSTPCIIIGINLNKDREVFTLFNFISEGGFEESGVVLGKNLAEDMNLGIGDYLFLTFRDRQGMFDSVEVQLSGLLNSPSPMVNNSAVFMSLKDAKGYFAFNGVTEISIKVDDYNRYKQYKIDLEKSLSDYKVASWAEINEDILQITQVKKSFTFTLVLFIVIIALVGIVNTMLMSVYEKQKEIGTLKALGFLDREILLLFIFEGVIIGVLGGITGIILGALANWYFVVYGIDFTVLMGSSDIDIGYRVMGIVKSTWDISAMINSLIVCVIASVLASYYPARKATKMQPMEALRVIQ